jgi:hypothetical protein
MMSWPVMGLDGRSGPEVQNKPCWCESYRMDEQKRTSMSQETAEGDAKLQGGLKQGNVLDVERLKVTPSARAAPDAPLPGPLVDRKHPARW